jgi:hypothetical protein
MVKDLIDTMILLSLMVLTMRQSQSIQVGKYGILDLKYVFLFHEYRSMPGIIVVTELIYLQIVSFSNMLDMH